MASDGDLLHHFLAALAYRTRKALRGAPAGFAGFRAAAGVRTPQQIVRHMSDVLGYARVRLTGGPPWRARSLDTLEAESARLHQILADLGARLEAAEIAPGTVRRLLQGPLADAMTHAGQLAMLRRLAGAPIPPENFFDAAVDAANLGPDQPEPASPDRDWFDAEDEPF